MSLDREHITKEMIGAAFEVHHALGYGFLEKVYQKAMIVELKIRGLEATAEKLIQVHFKNHIVATTKLTSLSKTSLLSLKLRLNIIPKTNRSDSMNLLRPNLRLVC